jgi:hypothetical protein
MPDINPVDSAGDFGRRVLRLRIEQDEACELIEPVFVLPAKKPGRDEPPSGHTRPAAARRLRSE